VSSGNFCAESSQRVLERAKTGDRDALDELCRRYREPLHRWAKGRLPLALRAVVDTDDLVQDTMINAVARIESFEIRGPSGFRAYLRRALINRLSDERRRAAPAPMDPASESLAAQAPSSLEKAIGAEQLALYESAMERLDPDERSAIHSRIELGLSFSEVADVLGKSSPDAARMAVKRAILKLAREIAHGEQRSRTAR
jgi:RNA polymerase sigma-70 factor (ECF subfamily)